MSKKKVAAPRARASARIPAAPVVSSPPPVTSPAEGVRVLRQRIEARTTGRQSERQALSKALALLEEDFDRIVSGSGTARAALLFGAAPVTAQKAAGKVRPASAAAASSPRRQPVAFVPTMPDVVSAMLELAAVTEKDVVYDLGCGDGRIVIAAAKLYGAKGVGIDNDPVRIAEAKKNAAGEGVGGRVRFLKADLFEADVRKASVVTLYLLPTVNLELMQRLLDQLEPGSRIVSHEFDMGAWRPSERREFNGRSLYLWVVPERV